MIAVDTSALVAIVRDEDPAKICMAAIHGADRLLISAGTVTEALIVAARRGHGPAMRELIDRLDFEIIDVTLEGARAAANAYDQWGKGVHPAGLNFGDCFAYAIAKSNNCPLLFIGNDFAQTDVTTAIA